MSENSVLVERDRNIAIVTINRPQARNAVDSATADRLAEAFQEFDHDETLAVAILTGAQGTFCAGADLREVAAGTRPPVTAEQHAPMGPTWMLLSKPVLAAVEGHAVAGGLELALWCDLRIAARNAVFGVFCRRWGVPLIDMGTVRLPRLIGQSHALDLILTGRGVSGEEALRMGLANRLTEPGKSVESALELAHSLAAFPQNCLRADRLSAYEQWSMPLDQARRNELRGGLAVLASGESQAGAERFSAGAGRHGSFT
ncbi:MAG TPA: crotonase/enoyl-CoA hydratase family protein [Candidatus Angelobacter sp.]|jgi:enoyl-CoA hydratase|nr:crotonase/enoyl-CoA hydratase family protein [Candidatus Angelobacter sp.]